MSIVNDLRLIPNFLKVDNSGSAVFSGSLTITNGITGSIAGFSSVVSSSSQLNGTTIENLTIGNLLVSGTTELFGKQSITGALEIYSSSNPELRFINETTDIQYHIQNGDGGHFQIHNSTTDNLLFKFQSGSAAQGNQDAYFYADLFVSQSVVAHKLRSTGGITGSIASTNGVVSGSSQIIYENISSIPSGIVSGSSQITYVNVSSIPAGIVSGSSQITLSSTTGGTTSSNVQFNSLGIGMAASATAGRIDASGDIVAYSTSDRRFKENITPIPNAIEKITKISGNTYDWKKENKDIHGFEGNDVGVVAQEIEAILPQLVTTRENGYKAVKYDKLVALLIEGIKEQQIKIDNLTIVVENLKKQKGL